MPPVCILATLVQRCAFACPHYVISTVQFVPPPCPFLAYHFTSDNSRIANLPLHGRIALCAVSAARTANPRRTHASLEKGGGENLKNFCRRDYPNVNSKPSSAAVSCETAAVFSRPIPPDCITPAKLQLCCNKLYKAVISYANL